MGFISVGIKDILYAVFVFFYFSQILGLDQIYTGTATLIAILFDAISDPIVGSISDNYNSKKWGRRHPFMLISAFPLGISTFLLFSPFSELNQLQLFLWMTFFFYFNKVFFNPFFNSGYVSRCRAKL
jgi:Na+/melibiose symporter-like transporter